MEEIKGKNRILNKTGAADHIGIHRHTFRKWKKQGIGPKFFTVPGGGEYTTVEACDKFLAGLIDETDA